MILEIDDWKFHVFSVTTRKYYARQASEHCQCAWCRNFYTSVHGKYPNMRPFLDRFGVHIEAPDEMMAFSPTMCANYYAVCGEILERGEGPIMIDGIPVEPQSADESMVNTELDGPCFFLYVGCMTLPWVLDEPMEEADSPAKGQNPIVRLLRRWITDET